MKGKFFLLIGLVLAISLSHVGCVSDVSGNGKDTGGDETPETLETNETPETEKVKYVYQTKYVDCEFVTDGQKQEWRAALTSLLNNEKRMVYENFEEVGYTILYPDRPYIENGYQLALLDINADGMPELLVNMGGGSAGNASFYVYDIPSGTKIGSLDGGHDYSWCMYFNQSTGSYETIGCFEWRIGWSGSVRFVNRAAITDTMDGNDPYLREMRLMCASYEIDAVQVELTEEEREAGIRESWDTVCTGAEFWVDGSKATIESYFDAQDHFAENYIRIAETGIRLISWGDVTDAEDSVEVKAQKMAEALLTSSQKFLQPLPRVEE